jgi:hypothetical protein
MHIHASQPNAYAQLDLLRSTQRADARREAERVRKELLRSASELAGESDCNDLSVASTRERKEFRKRTRGGNKQAADPAETQELTDAEDAGGHISDWA